MYRNILLQELNSSIDILKSISLLDVVEEREKQFVCINKKNIVSDFLNGLIRPFLVAYWVRQLTLKIVILISGLK